MFGAYAGKLCEVRKKLSGLKCLELIRTECYDISKLIIYTGSIEFTGKELYRRLLSEYHLQMEMAAGSYVLAMTSVSDTKEGLERLTNALFRIDNKIGAQTIDECPRTGGLPRAEVVCSIADAERKVCADAAECMFVPWDAAAGYVSAEYAYLYPPGSPLIVPGERISEEAVRMLFWYRDKGFSVEGFKRERYVEVLKIKREIQHGKL